MKRLFALIVFLAGSSVALLPSANADEVVVVHHRHYRHHRRYRRHVVVVEHH
jgi:hypothetical protein